MTTDLRANRWQRKSAAERFVMKVERKGADECWLWLGGRTTAGYGTFYAGPTQSDTVYAHRFAYEYELGSIPPGLQIDHLCRNRACVNPAHLELVDSRTNTLRGDAPHIVLHREGRCKRGHSLAYAYIRSDGRVGYCRACRSIKRRAGEWKR